MPQERCPLCRQPVDIRVRKAREGTITQVIAEAVNDVRLWAEGDVVADDGEFLTASDLARHLAQELTLPLMKLYEKELQLTRAARASLAKRINTEREIVTFVDGGLPAQKRGPGRPRRAFCLRGHARTSENVNSAGACMPCRAERYAEQKLIG